MTLSGTLVAVAVLIASPQSFPGDLTAERCPVVGNRVSRIYHTPENPHYRMMLEKNRGADNRECFANERDARAAGFYPSQAKKPD